MPANPTIRFRDFRRPAPPRASAKIAPTLARTPSQSSILAGETPAGAFQATDAWEAEERNPIRRAGLNLALAFIFLRFTGLHQILTANLGFNTYILYVIGAPAIACLLLSGGLARTMRTRQAKYWAGFAGWLILAIPFSDWPRGSFSLVLSFMRTNFIVLFLIAGLVMTCRECWRLANVLGLAAVTVVFMGYFFRGAAPVGDDRLELSDVTMGNSNDYAALMMLLLPFLILVVVTPKRSIVLRLAALGGLVYGLYLTLQTGSRGAEVALIATVIFALARVSPLQRVWIGASVIVGGFLLFAVLPGDITQRLANLSWNQEEAYTNEAAGSAESRVYLLKKSLLFTAQHPLFGVGPGEFSDHEGFAAKAAGQRGNWHQTHNTYTQASSEAGIPAAIFLILALGSSYGLLNRTLRRVRSKPHSPENQKIAATVFCALISVVAFCSSIFFLSLAYQFFLPALTGLAIVLSRAAQREWDGQSASPHLAVA